MFKSIALLALLPFVAQARVRGQSQRGLSKSKDDKDCEDVPLRVRSNGEAVFFGTMYVGAFYEKGDSPLMDDVVLCDTYMAKYNNNTQCSHLAGSYREVGACQVLDDAVGPEDSILLKLEYFSNSEDGDILYSQDQVKGECDCLYGSDQETIIGIEYQGTCNCFCDPKDFMCNCIAPIETTVVDESNKMYTASVQGTTITFTDFPQLELLDIYECNVNITQYNETNVCPGMQSQAFSDLLTDFPSATPTDTPSDSPTEFPSKFPSEFPSEFPTEFATDAPTSTPV